MKCCILEAPGRIRIADAAMPRPGPRDVVLRVRAALTCGTDLKAYRRGHPKMPFPTPFGHEFSGEIVEVGDEVADFAVGDAVMSANTGPCGQCFYCVRDQENLCQSLMDEMVLGGYAEFLRLPERVLRSNVFLKPEHLPFAEASLLEPLSSVCFGLTCVAPADLDAGATAVVIGAGPIGLLWLVALKASRVGRVIVAGRRRARLEVASAMGADTVVGEEGDLDAMVAEVTQGRRADVVVECTGLPEVWERAPTLARRGGSVVLFGGCAPGSRVTWDPYRLHYDGVQISSPFHFRPRDVEAAYEMLCRRDLDWSPLITSRATLDDVPRVFEELANGHEVKCAILPHGE